MSALGRKRTGKSYNVSLPKYLYGEYHITECRILLHFNASLDQIRKLTLPFFSILFMGLSLPEHGYHAPNEFFDWGQASGGMRAFVEYFSQVAHMRDG